MEPEALNVRTAKISPGTPRENVRGLISICVVARDMVSNVYPPSCDLEKTSQLPKHSQLIIELTMK